MVELPRARLARECGRCIALSVAALVALGADGPGLAKLSRPARRAGDGSFFTCNLANLAKVALGHLRLVGKIVDAAERAVLFSSKWLIFARHARETERLPVVGLCESCWARKTLIRIK